MIRIVAENIVLFLLPTIVYVAYIYLTRDEKPGAARECADRAARVSYMEDIVFAPTRRQEDMETRGKKLARHGRFSDHGMMHASFCIKMSVQHENDETNPPSEVP